MMLRSFRPPILLSLLSCLALAASAAAPAPALARLPDDARIWERARDFVDGARGAPGVVIAVRDRDGTRILPYGYAEAGVPMSASARFEIGSITKGFNALLLADMERRGEVRATDTVADLLPPEYLPLADAIAAITLEDLASHHSGLPRLAFGLRGWLRLLSADPYAGATPDELFRLLARQDADAVASARGRFRYSNFGAALLGQLLARRAGMPYEALLRERVLAPLGIGEAAFLDGGEIARAAQGHARGRPVASWRMDAYAPAGGLVLTAGDLLAAGERLLAPAPAFADAFVPRHALGEGEDGGAVGLGWFRDRIGGHETWWHNGGTSGSRSFLGVVPAQGRVVVVLANGDGDADALARRLLEPGLPAQTRRVPWLRTLGTALGLLGVPAWLLLALRRRRAQDRIRALTRCVEAAVALVLLLRLGDWISLPLASWWICAGLSLALALWGLRRAGDIPWPRRRDRWRSGFGLAFGVAVLAILLV